MKLDSSLIEGLKKLKWFENCGKPSDFSFAIQQLDSWSAVSVACSDGRWIEATEDAQGDLTEYLSNRYPSDYQGVWNKLVREAKDTVNETAGNIAKSVASQNGLPQDFVDGVKWDVLHGIMEVSYKNKKPPQFFERLLDVYQGGHYPCGIGPDGEIIIF